MTAPRVPLTAPRGRKAAPVGVPIATAMFDALNRAQEEKAAAEAARLQDERAQAELARKRTMEDTRLRLDIDKAGYRIQDPTAERGQDEIVIGASPLGSGVLTRIDPMLAKQRKAKSAFARLQARDPEKWREPVEDFDYEAAETRELAIDGIADQLEQTGLFRGLNKAQIRAQAAGIASENPKVQSLFEAAVKARIPKTPEPMSESDRRRFALDERRVALLEQAAKDKRDGTGGEAVSPLPSTARAKLAGMDVSYELLKEAETAIKNNPTAFGAQNMLGRRVVDRMSPEMGGGPANAGVRSQVETITGEIRNSRFGGALTPVEAEYALSMLPAPSDPYEIALEKTQKVLRYIEAKRGAMLRAYGRDPSRYPVGTLYDRPTIPATPPPTMDETDVGEFADLVPPQGGR